MTGLVVVGGEGPSRAAFAAHRAGAELVIAADSGLATALDLGLAPDLVVGDMDSVGPELLARVPASRVLRFPADKDETDAEIGVRLARERGCARVVVVGGGGGQADHFIGILLLFERAGGPDAWITRGTVFERLVGRARIAAREGQTLSFFPLGREARVSSSSGLVWPLDGMCLRRGQASLRNRAAFGRIEIDIGEGGLLMARGVGEHAGGTGQA